MNLQSSIVSGLWDKCPGAYVYQDICLDSHRGKGAKADLIVLHKTGLYLLLTVNINGMLYGNDNTDQWMVRYSDGKPAYIPNPAAASRYCASLLAKKLKGTAPYIRPAVLFGEDTMVVELSVKKDVEAYGAELFLSTMMLREHEERCIPPQIFGQIQKQLQLLEMLSK